MATTCDLRSLSATYHHVGRQIEAIDTAELPDRHEALDRLSRRQLAIRTLILQSPPVDNSDALDLAAHVAEMALTASMGIATEPELDALAAGSSALLCYLARVLPNSCVPASTTEILERHAKTDQMLSVAA